MTKEHPILFKAEMVRAILDGRKTQTRRLVKPHPFHAVVEGSTLNDEGRICTAPLGQPGDRLWVKETFKHNQYVPTEYVYKATETDPDRHPGPWKPSIFMPRKASRLTLELTGVRVERLNDISEADALAEGVEIITSIDHGSTDPVRAYAALWESINGKGSWAQNPWVWVYSFKKL